MKKYILGLSVAAVLMCVPVVAVHAGGCQYEKKPCLSATRYNVEKAAQAKVYWSAPTEANSYYGGTKTVEYYRLQVSKTGSFSNPLYSATYSASTSNGILTKLEGLRPLQQYYVRIKAVYTNGNTSKWSELQDFRTGVNSINNTNVPKKLRKKHSVTVKWKPTARMQDLNMYYDVIIQKKLKDGTIKRVAKKIVIGKSQTVIKNLKSGKRYRFRVRARDSVYGSGDYSIKEAFRTR
ncbi:fibronectin type III domain-containing protein [Patescibacteria group bacterium]